MRFEGNRIDCFPRDQSLSDLFYSPRKKILSCTNFLKINLSSGQHPWITVHCYSLMSQILQCCPFRYFGGKQFHCQMSCELEVTNETARCWEKNFSYITREVSMLCFCTETIPSSNQLKLSLKSITKWMCLYQHNNFDHFTLYIIVQ